MRRRLNGSQKPLSKEAQMRRKGSEKCMRTDMVFHKIMPKQQNGIEKPLNKEMQMHRINLKLCIKMQMCSIILERGILILKNNSD